MNSSIDTANPFVDVLLSAESCLHGMRKQWCSLCNPSERVSCSIRDFARKHKHQDDDQLVSTVLLSLSEEKQFELLRHLLRLEISRARRDLARVSEQRSEKAIVAEGDIYEQARVEKLFTQRPWEAPKSSKLFRKWKRNPDAAKMRQAVDSDYARYVERCKQLCEEPSEVGFRSFQLDTAFDNFRQATRHQVILEITDELLVTEFVLSDGTEVSWGTATAEQHLDRAKLLLSQATGNVATAKRHEAAVKLLKEKAVISLNEITR